MQTYWKLRSYLPAFQLHSLMFSRHISYLTDLSTLSGRLTRRVKRLLIWPQNHKTVLHLIKSKFVHKYWNYKDFKFLLRIITPPFHLYEIVFYRFMTNKELMCNLTLDLSLRSFMILGLGSLINKTIRSLVKYIHVLKQLYIYIWNYWKGGCWNE